MMSFIFRMFSKIGKWFGGLGAASFAVEVAKFGAWKILLTAFYFTGVYVLLNNLMVFFMEKISSMLVSHYGGVDGGVSPFIIQLTGLGAYLAQKMMLVESFTAIMTGLSLAVVRNFLPFPFLGK